MLLLSLDLELAIEILITLLLNTYSSSIGFLRQKIILLALPRSILLLLSCLRGFQGGTSTWIVTTALAKSRLKCSHEERNQIFRLVFLRHCCRGSCNLIVMVLWLSSLLIWASIVTAHTRLRLLMDLVNHSLKAELLVIVNELGLLLFMTRKLFGYWILMMCARGRCWIVCAGGDLFIEGDRGGMGKVIVVVSCPFSRGCCSTCLTAHFGNYIVFMLLDGHTDGGATTVPCCCIIEEVIMTHHRICILFREEQMLLRQKDMLGSSCEELLLIILPGLRMHLELR